MEAAAESLTGRVVLGTAAAALVAGRVLRRTPEGTLERLEEENSDSSVSEDGEGSGGPQVTGSSRYG
jgi:hypothetical protein